MRFAIAIAVSAVIHAPLLADPEPETAPVYELEDVSGCTVSLPPELDDGEPPPPEPMRLDDSKLDPAVARDARAAAILISGTSLILFGRPLSEEPPPKPKPRREVEVGYVTRTGDLDRRVVRRFVRFRTQELAACNHMQIDEVKVEIDLFVASDGAARPTVTGDERIAACVERELRAIEFPRSGAGATQARFSITLRPRVTTSLYGTISNEPVDFVR